MRRKALVGILKLGSSPELLRRGIAFCQSGRGEDSCGCYPPQKPPRLDKRDALAVHDRRFIAVPTLMCQEHPNSPDEYTDIWVRTSRVE